MGKANRLFEVEDLKLWLTAPTHPQMGEASPMEEFKITQSKQRAAGLLKNLVQGSHNSYFFPIVL